MYKARHKARFTTQHEAGLTMLLMMSVWGVLVFVLALLAFTK